MTEYDSKWPSQYEEEKSRITAVIGRNVVAIEHIGSRAVPGLGAKPIIDIMEGVRQLADAELCIELVHNIGYEYVPEYEASIPERRYFREGPPGERTHHIHMVELYSDFWERHLLFRDFVCAHPEVAQQYYELKKELAKRRNS